MKMSFFRSSLMLLSLSVVGCSTSGGGGSTMTGTGPAVAQDDMPEYCQNAASTQYSAPLGKITTVSAVTRSFGFLVTGTANNGQSTYLFNCTFDTSGRFIGVSEQ